MQAAPWTYAAQPPPPQALLDCTRSEAHDFKEELRPAGAEEKRFFSRVPLIPESTDFTALAQGAHPSHPPSVGPLVPLAPLWCDSRLTRSAQEPGTDGRAAKLLNPAARKLKGRPHGVLPKSVPLAYTHARDRTGDFQT